MKVKVYSFATVKKTEEVEHIISIRNPSYKHSVFDNIYKELDDKVLPLFDSSLVIICDDITEKPEGEWELLFNQTDARKILAFVKGKENIAIHCNAGMSRSVAVGTFLKDYFNADVSFTVTGHDKFRNIHIVNVLRRVFLEKKYGNIE